MSAIVNASGLAPLMEMLTLKSGETNATVGSIVGHVTAEPGLIGPLCEKLGEQVSSADKDPVVACKTFEALANGCGVLAEPHIAAQLPVLLAAAAHKLAPVRQAAEDAVKAFASKMSVHAVPSVLTMLFKVHNVTPYMPYFNMQRIMTVSSSPFILIQASEVGVAWQTRALALRTVAGLADHAPEVMGQCLPTVVPEVRLFPPRPLGRHPFPFSSTFLFSFLFHRSRRR
jgi:hypothetical protein